MPENKLFEQDIDAAAEITENLNEFDSIELDGIDLNDDFSETDSELRETAEYDEEISADTAETCVITEENADEAEENAFAEDTVSETEEENAEKTADGSEIGIAAAESAENAEIAETAETTETTENTENAVQAEQVREMPAKELSEHVPEEYIPLGKVYKKRSKLWIPIVFLSAAVIALGVTVGVMWQLLHKKVQEPQVSAGQPEQTTTLAELPHESELIDYSENSENNNTKNETEYIEIAENGKITYWDSAVGYSWTPILDGVELNDCDPADFTVNADGRVEYRPDGELSSFFGIDVSSHQKDIDWQLVREDDVEFAFLRIGYRGYGEEGNMKPDEYFEQNYTGASEAGIGVGVYFFSQAMTVEEAVEEANYVLELLDGRALDYPVVFDWETITGLPEGEHARTEDVTAQTLTLAAIAFCDTISAAGYEPMIYTNKKQAVLKFDLRKLTEYPVWFAYYDTTFDYCYKFDFWQYGFGTVDGIVGDVDLNVAILR